MRIMITYLTGNTSGDNNDLDTLESLVELVCGVAIDLVGFDTT